MNMNKTSDLIKRAGKFKIHIGLIRGENNHKLLRLFANTIIIRAEHKYFDGFIEYEALSPLFRQIEEGEVIPEYEITFTTINADENVIDYVIDAKEIDDERE